MDANIQIKIGSKGIPEQEFNGIVYYLYPGERYFIRFGKRMHIAVWESERGPIPKGYDIHHKDGNQWNNAISNLETIEGREHNRIHGKKRAENKEWLNDFHKKGIEAAKEWHRSEEGREWHSMRRA